MPLAAGRRLALNSVGLTLTPVGHLLGACSVGLDDGHQRLAFSGDVGRQHDLLLPPPQPLAQADVLLVESAYGNRRHPPNGEQAVTDALGRIVRDTIGRGGSVLLPAFAVGRAQALLVLLQRLRAAGEIPHQLPIFLDSPMAIEATALYTRHRRLLRVPQREISNLTDGVHLVNTAAMSQRLAGARMPRVIISASGLATGGRVLQHLQVLAPDPRHHIVMAGFQVGDSRGARLLAGDREIKKHGAMVTVRAQVSALEGVSGHADADEMLGWLRQMPSAPRQTFVVHGEPDAADTLRRRLQDELGWTARVPQHGERVEI